MMFFRSATTLAFFAAAVTHFVNADSESEEEKTLCFDYSKMEPISLDRGECTVRKFNKYTKDMFQEMKDLYPDQKCKGGVKNERMAMTGTTSEEDAEKVVEAMCRDQLAAAARDLPRINDWDIEDVDLQDFYDGIGFLNNETGNFKQEEQKFYDRGGYDKYNVISEDPRLNDHYPTTQRSYDAGMAVAAFYEESTRHYFGAPTNKLGEGCGSFTAMCCWHRDRQYFDQNGNCGPTDCANQEPGDNTDLCWTEDDGEVYPWPGSSTEGDLHCHGISWGEDDDSGYDINTMAKWNSLFYVSMYDHMYKRGYVGSITGDRNIAGSQPMCGCVEEMAPVARADCEQVTGSAEYTLAVGEDGMLVIEKVDDTFELEFESCEGYEFLDDFEPEDYQNDIEKEELKTSNNDLAGFVFKQYLEGKISKDQTDKVAETLIGYRNPDVNKNDKKREEACEEAFLEKFPGRLYEERLVSDIVGNSISA